MTDAAPVLDRDALKAEVVGKFRRAADAREVSDMVLGRIGQPIVVLDHA